MTGAQFHHTVIEISSLAQKNGFGGTAASPHGLDEKVSLIGALVLALVMALPPKRDPRTDPVAYYFVAAVGAAIVVPVCVGIIMTYTGGF